MTRVAVKGGQVVTPDGVHKYDIAIEDGVIRALTAPGFPAPCDEVIDARGKFVLPGAIDAHSHFIENDPDVAMPNPEEFEGFENGSRAAAAGGITTVIEMPQSDPRTTSGERLRRKRELALQETVVDFGLWGGLVPDQPEAELGRMLAEGAAGFKAYMCGSDESFPGLDDARLLSALRALAPTGAMVGLHAENDALLREGIERMRREGRVDPLAHADSRPSIVEAEAVNRAIFFSEMTGAHVHIVHMSAPSSARLVGEAKRRGINVTCETSTHYLVLDLDDLARLGPFAKVAPSLRSRAEVEDLWHYVLDGTIDCLASDHCAFTAASKEPGWQDIWEAPNGLSAIQTLVPVFVDEALKRGATWAMIAAFIATNASRLWGFAPRKGAIAVGADADLTLLELNRPWTIHGVDLLHTQKWTPMEGRTINVRVLKTLLRGETVFNAEHVDSPILVRPGFGEFLAPTRSAGERAAGSAPEV